MATRFLNDQTNKIQNNTNDFANITNLITNDTSGRVFKVLNEANCILTSSSQLTMQSGLIVVKGFRIQYDNAVNYTITATSERTVQHLVQEVVINGVQNSQRIFIQEKTTLIQDDILQNLNGTYQLEICEFITDSTGLIEVNNTSELITGISGTIDARNVLFDNSDTDLTSTNVQDALEEINNKIDIEMVDYSDTIINDTNEFIIGQGTNIDVSDNVANGNLRNVKLFGQSTDIILPAETIDINGNFEIDSGWDGNNSHIEIRDNVCFARSSLFLQNIGISRSFSSSEIILSHKYFLKIDVFAPAIGDVRLGFSPYTEITTQTIPNQWVSAYNVQNYFSTLSDFRALVDTIHFPNNYELRFRRAVLVDLTELGLEDLTADQAFARLRSDGLTFDSNIIEKQYTSQNITITNEATDLNIQVDATQPLRANNNNTVRDELDIDNSRLTQRINSNGDVLMEPIIHDLPPFNRLRVDNGNIINVTIDNNTNLPIINYEAPIEPIQANLVRTLGFLRDNNENLNDNGNYQIKINNDNKLAVFRQEGNELNQITEWGSFALSVGDFIAQNPEVSFIYENLQGQQFQLIGEGSDLSTVLIGNDLQDIELISPNTPTLFKVNLNAENRVLSTSIAVSQSGEPVQVLGETLYRLSGDVTSTEDMIINSATFQIANASPGDIVRICIHDTSDNEIDFNVDEADFHDNIGASVVNGINTFNFKRGRRIKLGQTIRVIVYFKNSTIQLLGDLLIPGDDTSFFPATTISRKTGTINDIITDQNVYDKVKNLLVAGNGITITNDDVNQNITISLSATPPTGSNPLYIQSTDINTADQVDINTAFSSTTLGGNFTIPSFTGNKYLQILQPMTHERYSSILFDNLVATGDFTITDNATIINTQEYRQYVSTYQLIGSELSNRIITLNGGGEV